MDNVRFCSKCGQKMEGDVKFCPSCGGAVESAVSTEPAINTVVNEISVNSEKNVTTNTVVSKNKPSLKARFCSFEGRLARMEFFKLGIGMSVLCCIDLALMTNESLVFLAAILMIPLLISGISLQVRRLHDLDKSGWYILAGNIPVINLILMYYLVFVKGTNGDNRFGADPLH